MIRVGAKLYRTAALQDRRCLPLVQMKDWHYETIVIFMIVAYNHSPVSYSERGSKTAIVTVSWPKIAYDNFLTVSEIQHDHRTVFAAMTQVY